MIHYEASSRTFFLETQHSSYIIRILDNGTIVHSYYGARIPREDISYINIFRGMGYTSKMANGSAFLSPDMVQYELPTSGRGDFREPAVCVCGLDGTCVNELHYVSHRIIDGKPKLKGLPQLDANIDKIKTLEVCLVDNVSGYEVMLSYSVFPDEDIISRHTTIKNISNHPIAVNSVASASLDFPCSNFEMISLEGSWARERSVERYPLHHGISSIYSRRGATSHQSNPFAALVEKNTDEYQGIAYGFTLIYSGDFRISAEVDQMNSTRLQIGLNPDTFSWTLSPGESFCTPEALMTYSSSGLNQMSQNFHSACRNHLGICADKNIVHPIVINCWEAMYYDYDDAKIRQFINDCAGLGIDTVVIDDGWYGCRADINSSLGDWTVNRQRFPNGLNSIVHACHENGMRLGLWFEPEMVSKNSNLFRAHPDWCIHVPGRSNIEARNQLVLNMSHPDVVNHIYLQISAIVDEYQISYIKWDMNRNLTDNYSVFLNANQQSELSHRYILGVYRLLDRLHTTYPNLFIEGCSGGGGRFDFGMLYYMPQIWTSDNTDPMERLKIQYGTSYVYPPNTMVAHVTASPNHQTGRSTSFSTRGNVAQMCSFGYELDVATLTNEDRSQIIRQINKHRDLEAMINNGLFYRLQSPFDGSIGAWQMVSPDYQKAYVMIAFRTVTAQPIVQHFKLKGLNPETQYHIPQLGITRSGQTLMHVGIPVRQPSEDYPTVVFDLFANHDS